MKSQYWFIKIIFADQNILSSSISQSVICIAYIVLASELVNFISSKSTWMNKHIHMLLNFFALSLSSTHIFRLYYWNVLNRLLTPISFITFSLASDFIVARREFFVDLKFLKKKNSFEWNRRKKKKEKCGSSPSTF